MPSLNLKAPAKINLYLRLTGKRQDGFNNIITLFQKISLSDELIAKKAKSGCKIFFEGITPSCTLRDNIVYKAYRLLKSKYKIKGGVEFVIKKNIPFGGGLGGASSNAASAIKAVASLYGIDDEPQNLISLGAKLGADVPLFLCKDSILLGIERGDKLLGLGKNRQKIYVLLIIPEFHILTADVYKAYRYPKRRISLTRIMAEVIMIQQLISGGDVKALSGVMVNDLFKPASIINPEVKRIVNTVKKAGFGSVMMTGSGSCVFVLFDRKSKAEQARKKLDLYNWGNIIVCETPD